MESHLARPQISDLQFESKSGKTAEGWPVEQVKAGGLAGLCAYACFYATRKLRPGLVKDPKSLGLDAAYTLIFWTFFPTVAGTDQLCQQFIRRAREAVEASDPLTVISVCDALAEGVDPQHSYTSYLRPVYQAQLVAAARTVQTLADSLLAGAAAGSQLAPVLSLSVENLRVRIAECVAFLEFAGSQAGSSAGAESTATAIPASVRALVRLSATAAVSSSLWSAAKISDIAAQWTHTEAHLFRSIPMAEWIAAGWDKPRYEHAADCTRRFIDHFNATALWVTAEVLAQPTPEERAVVILHFIQVRRRSDNAESSLEFGSSRLSALL
jgi:hypothetical protein